MHDDTRLIEERIQRFSRDHLTDAGRREQVPVRISAHALPGEPVPPARAIAADDYRDIEVGQSWGRAWSTLWLHVTGTVPPGWDRPEDLCELVVDLDFTDMPGFQAEALVFTPQAEPLKAVNPLNSSLALQAGQEIDLYLECAANPSVAGGWTFAPTDLGDPDTVPERELYTIRALHLQRSDRRVRELGRDVRALAGLMRELPEAGTRRAEILRGLEAALDVVDPDDLPGTADAAREVLRPLLARPAHDSALTVMATGHAHIDSAWLWPVRETIRKCARTFSNAIALMDAEPDFTFSVSSAQQYLWMKESYPGLFERIREKVAEGRFVPVGGMWVESDTNMPGSEAMARQFVAGKRFFLEEFGVETTQTWLPDSFGYSAALPQIAALAGQDDFLTQKVSWNQVNTFPHHTFSWEGLDGTSVFTHFPPADTYNGTLEPSELAFLERNFKEKGRSDVAIDLFGFGDGGGGPSPEMIAAGRRAADLEGSPKVEFAGPEQFFDRARDSYPEPPVWAGELYLELHRGTYSAQLATKQGNRRSEALLHEAEHLATLAALRADELYPHDALEEIWHDALLLQFHDILPGSSIAWVHRDAERNHASIRERAERIIETSLAALSRTVGPDDPDTGEDEVLLNTAPVVSRRGIAPYSAAPAPSRGEGVSVMRRGDRVALDNGLVSALLDGRGEILSLIDGASGREAIAPGDSGARLQLHRDTPNAWDAWDIDAFYRHVVRDLDAPTSVEVDEIAGGARITYRYTTTAPAGSSAGVTGAGSEIAKTFELHPGDASLQITIDLDWKERRKALKLGFGLDLRAQVMSSEVQFGHVDRPIPVNTSWDAARFETCAHRFVHVAEGERGVALANDSTYGHDVLRTVREADGGTTTTVRATLVRSPEFPDPGADHGIYSLRFALRPGADTADAIAEGYRTNLPERVVPGGVARAAAPLARIEGAPGVLIETVKLAEDRSGDLVLRLYESHGERARARLVLDVPGQDEPKVAAVDLLERPFGEDAPSHLASLVRDGGDGTEERRGAGSAIDLDLRPFEIRTLRVVRA
ncbi:alpha-mannosidase [Brachybacterium endophyticum]|uniref:Alpha-mannosidase n=1 Tax=Brachybacterium endophyticum TaxID=2182385 RepID=A0A2U2RP19_9MICO|nr:glycoside hydrolase family 38 C-terminal domain-containing protein [Brachybacterium endophyticum]PWH07609.1 alpha-mannosidase [Brachybacterium endophyticum]